MSFRQYFLGIMSATLISIIAFLLVIYRLSPFGAGNETAIVLFHLSLFLALTGLLTILNFYLRLLLKIGPVYAYHLNIALRQGALLSIMVIIMLIFQSLRVLTWWDGLLLLIIISLIELFFAGKESKKEKEKEDSK